MGFYTGLRVIVSAHLQAIDVCDECINHLLPSVCWFVFVLGNAALGLRSQSVIHLSYPCVW